MYFWNYGMQETWLDKYLKSPVSEHPSTVNMLKTPKHFWYLHESSSNIFYRHSGGRVVGKSPSY